MLGIDSQARRFQCGIFALRQYPATHSIAPCLESLAKSKKQRLKSHLFLGLGALFSFCRCFTDIVAIKGYPMVDSCFMMIGVGSWETGFWGSTSLKEKKVDCHHDNQSSNLKSRSASYQDDVRLSEN